MVEGSSLGSPAETLWRSRRSSILVWGRRSRRSSKRGRREHNEHKESDEYKEQKE